MKKLSGRFVVALALPLLWVGAFGLISVSRGDTTKKAVKEADKKVVAKKLVTEDDYIGGDGGPMIVLQVSAAAKWQGSAHFESSLMNGGKVETDYDVICAVPKNRELIRRYNRDMLVLDDSEFGAYLFNLASGATVIVQQYMGDETTVEKLVKNVAKKRPTKSFRMNIQDRSLRLLVGADDGRGSTYQFKEVPVKPGLKRCDLFLSKNDLVIVIKPL